MPELRVVLSNLPDGTRLRHVGDILSNQPWEGTAPEAIEWCSDYVHVDAIREGNKIKVHRWHHWETEFVIMER